MFGAASREPRGIVHRGVPAEASGAGDDVLADRESESGKEGGPAVSVGFCWDVCDLSHLPDPASREDLHS